MWVFYRASRQHPFVFVFSTSFCLRSVYMANLPSAVHSLGTSVVWHLLLPLMNSFSQTEAASVLMQTKLPESVPPFLRYI